MQNGLAEEIRVSGKELTERIKQLIKEGNIRCITVKNKAGKTLFSLPLALGVAGAGGAFALAPILSSAALFTVLANDVRILVERTPDKKRSELDNRLKKEKEPGCRSKNNYSEDPFELDADFEVLK
ncbi:DUF4342 domain-containing protein [Balneolaceae bacterium ANBcel3]|nr:DUF4342 domain-containing protein [Balneolaceae bacterium ANBcel3]